MYVIISKKGEYTQPYLQELPEDALPAGSRQVEVQPSDLLEVKPGTIRIKGYERPYVTTIDLANVVDFDQFLTDYLESGLEDLLKTTDRLRSLEVLTIDLIQNKAKGGAALKRIASNLTTVVKSLDKETKAEALALIQELLAKYRFPLIPLEDGTIELDNTGKSSNASSNSTAKK